MILRRRPPCSTPLSRVYLSHPRVPRLNSSLATIAPDSASGRSTDLTDDLVHLSRRNSGNVKSQRSQRKNEKPMNPLLNTKNPELSTPWASGELPHAKFRPLSDIVTYPRKNVPKLAHGLDVVLSRKGVHMLKDPETNSYNFNPYLENIPRVDEFAFDKLGGFVPSSEDENMLAHAKRTSCLYAGSTSSLTGILTQIYLLLSEEKNISLTNLSSDFDEAPQFYTPGQRIPVSIILRYRDGVYATDVDSERDTPEGEIILLPLGTLLEKFLTLPGESFSKLMKSYSKKDHPKFKDVHRYAKHGRFMMRSQLDCLHDDLPGTGVFDLKTRAISQIRHDVYNYMSYVNCTLNRSGRFGSFEQEYYDMIRSAFLEYSFQARIGNMDGIFVAYHNTAHIFGFQYISLKEMDTCLFGREGTGDRVFLRCITMMELLYDEITKCFPAQSVKCTFEKRSKYLRVWVEPVEHHQSKGPPPVVELRLSLQNIMRRKVVKGTYAVCADQPWSINYQFERSEGPKLQSEIVARRNIAYKRQMSIASSHTPPSSDPDAIFSQPSHAKALS